MKNVRTNFVRFGTIILSLSLFVTGCLTPQKIDKFVATQYNDHLPKPATSSSATLSLNSALPSRGGEISTTVHKMDKFLPLLIYWHVRESQNCSLNTTIAQASISNVLNGTSTESIMQKLNGQKLELTLEEAPAGFSLIDDFHSIWLIYPINWNKLSVQPDVKDLVVSYKIYQSDNTFKTGKITVRNTQRNKNFRLFQNWKSAISEYIQSYNSNLTVMSRSLVTKLSEEL